jgi:hypothetical protein
LLKRLFRNPEYKVPLDIYYLPAALEYHFDKLKWELGGKVGDEPLPPDGLAEEDIALIYVGGLINESGSSYRGGLRSNHWGYCRFSC